MDISHVQIVIIGVLAIIGGLEMATKVMIPSGIRIGWGGVLLGTIIALFLLNFVFVPGSVLEAIAAYGALVFFAAVGGIRILKWLKIVPATFVVYS